MDYQTFYSMAQTFNIEVSQTQYQSLTTYADMLIDYNKKVNLTAIVEIDEIFIKHFLDSLLILESVSHSKTLADVGTGAGFPGMVLALFSPTVQVTLIEPTHKRVVFLEEVKDALQLDNVTILEKRSEDTHDYREYFDVVVSRAVARLDILLELCIPLVKVNGKFIALKGSRGKEEIEVALHALTELKSEIETIQEIVLNQQNDSVTRQNIIVIKKSKTPNKYPRMYSKIKKQPL
jgi:16S rRNA (guanine527-N7)-methyltransferase